MNQLIEQIVAAARLTLYRPVQRFQLKGSDGKFYSSGMPRGVEFTGERSAPYWVAESIREGTTHGKRFDSLEEYQADAKRVQEAKDAEFRTALEAMDETRLQQQAAYWLKTK